MFALAMASSPGTVITCAALLLSGIVVGILIGRWTASPASVGAHSEVVPTQVDQSLVLAAIQDLKQTLSRPTREADGRSLAGAATDESTAINSSQIDRLIASVDKLSELIEQRSKSMDKLRADKTVWEGQGFPSVSAVLDRIHTARRSNDPQWRQKVYGELSDAHSLWTRDEVLERYGKPTSLAGNPGGVMLVYSRDSGDGQEEMVMFLVSDGYVTSVRAD
jgi:hypothetical protein